MQDGDDAGASSGHDIGYGYLGAAGDGEGDGGELGDGSMESFKARESRRLQQNREAAKRFRQKKKNLMNVRAACALHACASRVCVCCAIVGYW